jgi:hypothetical protein
MVLEDTEEAEDGCFLLVLRGRAVSIIWSLQDASRSTELTLFSACVASVIRLAFLYQLRKPVDILCKS